ncbi:LuxR C-terminal-related transcriptional regulator [Variovorax sp. GT1P44]|uniref:LuxR C-terminal-related transcriptional regulator n=1 Tax=Variovorax sp. GT1P44 TaxID=3443742 RepID=UPI003F44F35E
MSYSVLVVDDHPILRRGIASVIEQEPRLDLAGESSTGGEGALLFSRLRPDVVLMNLSSGEAADVEGIERIRALDSSAYIINLTRCDHGEDIHDVLRAGARGYIRMDTSVAELVTCILRVAEGGRYLTPAAAAKLAETVWSDALSRRELDILKLVSTGKSNRDIGRAAGITEETVKSHVNRILSKLGVASRTEAVSVAVRRGVIRFA